MNAQVLWWAGISEDPPQRPLLVLALADDPTAVSNLPDDHGSSWRDSALSRVADYLGVPVVSASDPLPEHDLLLLGSRGRGITTLVSALAVHLFGAEPQLVTGHGSGISDRQWMDKVVDVRSRTMTEPPEPVALLAGILERATVPVLLDGVCAAAAAAVASTRPDVQAPVLGDEPAQRFFLDRANAAVWGTSGVGPGSGLGALSGLSMLRLALLAHE